MGHSQKKRMSGVKPDCNGFHPSFKTMLSEYGAILGHRGSFDSLFDLPMPEIPESGSKESAFAFGAAYQLHNLVRKKAAPNKQAEEALELSCFKNWLNTEERCRINNERFADFSGESLEFQTRIYRASRLIQSVLGDFNPDDFVSRVRFSSGASTGHTRATGHPVNKLSSPLQCTAESQALVLSVMVTDPHWVRRMPEITNSSWPQEWLQLVKGAKYDSVAKDRKKNRPIVIAPEGVNYVQLAIGSMIRECLLKVGINLNDQSINDGLAWMGSCNRRLSTIDQQDASGNIYYMLVMHLLGVESDWFKALESARCKWVKIPRKYAEHDPSAVKDANGDFWHPLQAYAGMGDGFCFELQSLIFWALARVSTDDYGQAVMIDHTGHRHCLHMDSPSGTYSIFGDDLIIPTDATDKVLSFFSQVGFIVNATKSFWGRTPFRESCGGHYINGYNVTPIYVKAQTGFDPCDWVWFLNSLSSNQIFLSLPVKVRSKFLERWKAVANELHPVLSGTQVPASYGLTAGWIVEPSEAATRRFLRTRYYVVRSIHEVYSHHNFDGDAAFHASLHGLTGPDNLIGLSEPYNVQFGKPEVAFVTKSGLYGDGSAFYHSIETSDEHGHKLKEVKLPVSTSGLNVPNRNVEPRKVLREHHIGWWD